MIPITFVVTCKGRLSFLKQSLPTLICLPNTRTLVVDYDCPDRCGDWIESTYPQVQVVRVADRPRFNQPEARNLGAARVETPWICFTDADILFDAKFSDVVDPLLKEGSFLCPEGRGPGLGGTILCTRADFQRIGGFDELLTGWGFDDSDFLNSLLHFRLEPIFFPGQLITHLYHDNDLRVSFNDNKDHIRSWLINRTYSQVKLTLMKNLPGRVSAAVRRQIYSWAVRAMEQVAQNQAISPLELGIADQELAPPKYSDYRVGTALIFRLYKSEDK